jgi:hypothetical protein
MRNAGKRQWPGREAEIILRSVHAEHVGGERSRLSKRIFVARR